MKTKSMGLVAYRLKAAKAPDDLFDTETVALISSPCRGNRRQVMNIATVLLDETYIPHPQ